MGRLILSLMMLFMFAPSSAQTRRALVIGIGQQQDKAWMKINGDRDVTYVEEMLKHADFNSGNIIKLVNRQATKAAIVDAFRSLAAHAGSCLLYTSPSPRDS